MGDGVGGELAEHVFAACAGDDRSCLAVCAAGGVGGDGDCVPAAAPATAESAGGSLALVGGVAGRGGDDAGRGLRGGGALVFALPDGREVEITDEWADVWCFLLRGPFVDDMRSEADTIGSDENEM